MPKIKKIEWFSGEVEDRRTNRQTVIDRTACGPKKKARHRVPPVLPPDLFQDKH